MKWDFGPEWIVHEDVPNFKWMFEEKPAIVATIGWKALKDSTQYGAWIGFAKKPSPESITKALLCLLVEENATRYLLPFGGTKNILLEGIPPLPLYIYTEDGE